MRIFLEDFYDFLDGLESSIVKMKIQITKLVGYDIKSGLSWNPDKIKWEKVQGRRGIFEKSEDLNNPEFKALLKDLAGRSGRLFRDGWFYWVYRNGVTVGRKRRVYAEG
ncbi:MAG: hypothetical protein ACKD6O_08260 [Candidatus Bathyarchaeota archaeon]